MAVDAAVDNGGAVLRASDGGRGHGIEEGADPMEPEQAAEAGRVGLPLGETAALIDLVPARLSEDLGAAPKRCQWIEGEGPFSDDDKCGAATVTDSAYCARHLARSRIAPADAAPADAGSP